MRSAHITLFLTLTCNQREHPGVAPLLNVIHEQFRNACQEVKDSAIQIYMTVILRCWTRTMKNFTEYEFNSKETLLATILMWVRAEFQTHAKLPHYHILLWCRETSEELMKSVQSGEKTNINALFRVLQHVQGDSLGNFHGKRLGTAYLELPAAGTLDHTVEDAAHLHV